MKIAIYARYSSDSQKPTSIDDQLAMCYNFIKAKLNIKKSDVLIFADAAKSGDRIASRDEFENMLTYVRAGQIDVVVAEGLDRLSRSLTDTSHTFDIFKYFDTKIITVQEGLISELHVGLKGTMNSLFLKDLKSKTKRGMLSRAKQGFYMGKAPYGYKNQKGLLDEKGQYIKGVIKIDREQANIVRRIYQEYADGKKIKDIVDDLNKDGIAGAKGGKWAKWALLTAKKVRAGLLRNELYNGKMIYNKTKTIKNPETGKRTEVLRPVEEWLFVDVPHLKIIDDDLWAKVRKRDDCAIDKIEKELKKRRKRKIKRGDKGVLTHNQNPLTGYVFCGVCGGRKSMGKFKRYVCDNNRYSKTCKNGRSANEDKIIEELKRSLFNSFHSIENFRKFFNEKQKLNLKLKKNLDKQIEDLEVKISNLGKGIANGIESYLDLALDLKKQQEKLKNNIKNLGTVNVPSEEEIRYSLSSAVANTFARKNRETTRNLISATVDKIILTPKPDSKLGENVKVYLQDDCWFNFYKSIIKK